MRLRRFEYFEPATLAEASALLARYGGRAQPLAGGTDLLVELKEQLRRADCVVNIKKIPGLGALSFDPQAGLRIGALVTAREIEVSSTTIKHYPSLVQAVRELGSIQVRNRATIIGNVCRASPSADTLPPLIADGAVVSIHGGQGTRSVPLEDFFTGPGKTVLKSDELVTEIAVPAPAPRTGKIYIKHGRRKAMELATVGVAVTLTLEDEIRIVLGAVAPTPIRAKKAEVLLSGRKIDAALIERAAQSALEESRPISNVRANAAYRREMVGVLTRRALQRALDLAR
ncbi:MAG TPA: xanthine dehydrogenase family protein subunit M [Burkholderiales bacterium]|nr:xanthine dehydrogenase family protein subunit M [Burkholderiales bacterium]